MGRCASALPVKITAASAARTGAIRLRDLWVFAATRIGANSLSAGFQYSKIRLLNEFFAWLWRSAFNEVKS